MANHRKVKQDNKTNESSKPVHVIGAKRGKTHAGKTRLVLVYLLLIGTVSGVGFASQLWSTESKVLNRF